MDMWVCLKIRGKILSTCDGESSKNRRKTGIFHRFLLGVPYFQTQPLVG